MLIGERVRLRALDTSDAEVIWPWYHDHEFSQLDGWRYPSSLSQKADWIRTVNQPGYGNLFLGIETETGLLIGLVSLKRAVPEDRSAEFGIAIERGHWEKGYGTDATRTILRFAFGEMNLHRVWLGVSDYNPRAQHVYEKCGFKVEGRQREARFHNGQWSDKIVMGILDYEYFKQEAAG